MDNVETQTQINRQRQVGVRLRAILQRAPQSDFPQSVNFVSVPQDDRARIRVRRVIPVIMHGVQNLNFFRVGLDRESRVAAKPSAAQLIRQFLVALLGKARFQRPAQIVQERCYLH